MNVIWLLLRGLLQCFQTDLCRAQHHTSCINLSFCQFTFQRSYPYCSYINVRRNLLSDPDDTNRNKVGGIRVTYYFYAFARSLYLFGYPNSLMTVQLKRALLWQFNVAGGNRISTGRHVYCPKFLPILTKLQIPRQIFIEIPQYQISLISVYREPL